MSTTLLNPPRIREFTLQDIPEVADLWQRAFRHSAQATSPALRSYFECIFFQNPWHDLDLPSLVYVADDGVITGFLGILPRRIIFNGQALRMAVATQLMLDPDRPRGFAALELMRRFFAGSQDLSYSDGANEPARRIWESTGGKSSLLFSMEWTRILRPAEAFTRRLQQHNHLTQLGHACQPVFAAMDVLASHVMPRVYHLPPANNPTEPASGQSILECLNLWCDRQSLRPHYDLSSLQWLLDRADESKNMGPLRKILVRDESTRPIGWFIYYVKPGDIGQVLQMGGHPRFLDRVVDALLHDAWKQGAIAVSGQMDPALATHFSSRHCRFDCPGLGVLIHSRNPDLLNAIHRGDAFLSRLDGEWWMRFGIDRKKGW